jgi:N-acyl-D-aspartate/D-glutamate deacylase
MRLLIGLFILGAVVGAQTFDIVLANGRVMDPETNLDAVRNVGIRGGKIAAVSDAPLEGRSVIDVKGLVVTAGFIDLHSHGQTPENYGYKARDGVTTALEMEVGVNPVSVWYAARDGKARINFGATSGHIPAAMAVLHDSGLLLPRDTAATRAPTPDEQRKIIETVRQGLDEGALGVGIGIAYVPKTTRAQILEVFQLAAQRHATIYVHMRASGPLDLGAIDSLQEVLADASATGASLHVVHISSTGLRQVPICLRMIAGARTHGLDVTTEAYPYTAGMTDLASAVFDEGWQERTGGIGYGDLQWALTGERLTADTFAKYRKTGGMVMLHSIPEDMVRVVMADPTVMVASDGILDNGKGHPRAAGSYARVLGRYVREQHAVSLMDALRKMSLLPAERLGIQSKGRLEVGADADITVFDPERVVDRATFENPAQYSEGIPYVLVNGVVVVRDGQLVEGVAPGRGLRR